MGTHLNRLNEAAVITSTHNLCFEVKIRKISKGGSHMRPRTNFVLALHGECLHSNTYKNAFICFEKTFLGLRIAP